MLRVRLAIGGGDGDGQQNRLPRPAAGGLGGDEGHQPPIGLRSVAFGPGPFGLLPLGDHRRARGDGVRRRGIGRLGDAGRLLAHDEPGIQRAILPAIFPGIVPLRHSGPLHARPPGDAVQLHRQRQDRQHGQTGT